MPVHVRDATLDRGRGDSGLSLCSAHQSMVCLFCLLQVQEGQAWA